MQLNTTINYHFVTSDTLYFLIAENRLFWTEGRAERKERIFELLIGLLSVRYNDFLLNCLQILEAYFSRFKRFIKVIFTVFSRIRWTIRWNSALFAFSQRSVCSEIVKYYHPKHLTILEQTLKCFWNNRFFAFPVCRFCRNSESVEWMKFVLCDRNLGGIDSFCFFISHDGLARNALLIL